MTTQTLCAQIPPQHDTPSTLMITWNSYIQLPVQSEKPFMAAVLSNNNDDVEPPEEWSTQPCYAPMQVSFDTEAAEIMLCSLNLEALFMACINL